MRGKKTVSFILSVALLLTAVVLPTPWSSKAYAAAPVSLTMQQAEAWAYAYSTQYQIKQFRYTKLCKNYQNALKSVATKWKDFGTIRWSLLFNIKWPEYPYMDEAMDLYMKGPGIMTEINALTRELEDTKFEIKQKIDGLFIDAYEAQEKVAFNEQQLKEAKSALERNKSLLASGLASAKDVADIEKNIQKLEQNQATLLRTFMTKMKSMKSMVGIDVTTGYQLVNPLVTAKLDRVESLQDIKTYAEHWDLAIYNSDLDISAGKQTLNLEMKLLREKYGGAVATYLDPHVNKILSAVADIDANYEQLKTFNIKAFNDDYEKFLVQIDKPWQGNYKILFIRIPKEWFKGKLSGIRYVENSQYIALDDAMQLKDDAMTNRDLRNTLDQTIENSFNAVKDAESAYTLSVQSEKESKDTLNQVMALNRLGQATYSETLDAQKTYQDAQLASLESLSTYTELLYGLDRISYGAISKLLKGESIKLAAGNSGISYADLTDTSKAYYYIQPLVAGMNFAFGVNIPADYEPKIDSYELWYKDSIQIGARTPITEQIIHLTLDYGDSNELEFRAFYNGEFVDQCTIDVNIPSGEINFLKALPQEAPTHVAVGTYTLSNVEGAALASTSLSFKMLELENIQYYTIVDENDNPLISDEPVPIQTPFNYLTLIAGDIGKLKMKCFDGDENLLYTANFKTDTFEIMAPLK